MESDKTTLEEFQDNYAKVLQYKNWKNLCELCTKEEIVFNAKTIAVLFAKHHRSKTIEGIKEKYELDELDGVPFGLNLASVENTYPETEIK